MLVYLTERILIGFYPPEYILVSFVGSAQRFCTYPDGVYRRPFGRKDPLSYRISNTRHFPCVT